MLGLPHRFRARRARICLRSVIVLGLLHQSPESLGLVQEIFMKVEVKSLSDFAKSRTHANAQSAFSRHLRHRYGSFRHEMEEDVPPRNL